MIEQPQGYEDEGMFWVKIENNSISVVCKLCGKNQTVLVTNQPKISIHCSCNPICVYNCILS